MKILVTGCRGMLGTDLVRVLSASHAVEGVDLEEMDITSADRVLRQIDHSRPEVVINTAAYTDVDGSEREAALCFRVNALGVENIARACRNYGTRLIHLSTDYVFDGQKSGAYREEDPPNPLGVYGRAKREGEERLLSLLPEACIVRTAWLYGTAGRNFVKAILAQVESGKSLRVVDDQRGSPTYTVDLAMGLKAAVENRLTGVYHFTNRGACTWFGFARRILELAGRDDVPVMPVHTKDLGRPAPRPANSVLDTRKFEAATGMTVRPWPEALQAYLTEKG